MQSPFVFDAHGTVIVMMDASDNYQKKASVANTYFGYHKKTKSMLPWVFWQS